LVLSFVISFLLPIPTVPFEFVSYALMSSLVVLGVYTKQWSALPLGQRDTIPQFLCVTQVFGRILFLR